MRRLTLWLKRGLATLVILLALAYVVDSLLLWNRERNNGNAFGTARVQNLLAVPRKDGRTEFMLGDETDERCVRSLFPHAGLGPCWYLNGHKQRRVDM